MRKSRFCFIITVLVTLILYLPIVILIGNSFNESRFGAGWMGFSLKWYERLFQEGDLWLALSNSLIIAISSTVTSTLLGSLAAFAIHYYKGPLQKTHYSLIHGPLIIPEVLMGISLLLFFIAVNISPGLFTVFVAHTTFCVGYVTMVMLAKLQNFDFSAVEAAQDLGASTWTSFRRVLLPLLAPGFIAAMLLSFTMSIDDFVITFFVAGEGTVTLPLYIYSMIKISATPVVNALSTLMILATILCVWLIKTYSREELL